MPSESPASSASASTGINAPGTLNENQPNYVAWMVAGLGLILLAFVFLNRRKKKK